MVCKQSSKRPIKLTTTNHPVTHVQCLWAASLFANLQQEIYVVGLAPYRMPGENYNLPNDNFNRKPQAPFAETLVFLFSGSMQIHICKTVYNQVDCLVLEVLCIWVFFLRVAHNEDTWHFIVRTFDQTDSDLSSSTFHIRLYIMYIA